MAFSWLGKLTRRRTRASTPARRPTRPRLEALEDRLAPAVRIWDGVVDATGGITANGNWNNAQNWVGDVAPVAGDDVVFRDGAQRKTGQINNLTPDILLNSVTYEGSGFQVLSSNRFTLGAGGLNATNTSGTNTLGASILLNATRNIGVANAAAQLTISGAINGAGGFIKGGAGTLLLSAANNYSGLTSVTAGTVQITNSAALGGTAAGTEVTGTGSVHISPTTAIAEPFSLNSTGGGNGALLALGNQTLTGPIALVGPSAIGAATGAILGISGVVSGPSTAGLQKVGNGRMDVSAANNYSGATSVSAGSLFLFNAAGLGTATGGTTVQSGATLRLNSLTIQNERLTLSGRLSTNATANAWNGDITVTGNAFVDAFTGASGNAVLTLGGALQGSGNLTKDGPNVVTITGNGTNSIGGKLTVARGTLRLNTISGPTSTPSAFGGDLIIGDGAGTATVILQNHSQIPPTSDVTINRLGTLSLNGFNTNISNLTMTAGTVTTGAGTFTVNGNVTATSTSSTEPARIQGKLSRLASTVNPTIFDVSDGPASSDLIIDAVLSGTKPVTKNGAGRMELTAANTYAQATTINAGVLRITDDQALGNTSGVTVNSGGTLEVLGPFSVAKNLTLNGAGTGGTGALSVQGSGTTQFANPITLGSDATVRTLANANFQAAVGGAGGLTKTGSSQLTLSTANTYGGATTLSGGTLHMLNAQGLGSTTAGTTVQSGSTLSGAFAGTSAEPLTLSGIGVGGVGALFATGTFSGNVTLASNSRVGGPFDGLLTLAGAIGGAFEIDTRGIVTFSGTTANSHASTHVGDGQLTLNKTANTTAVAGALTVETAGTVRVASPQQIADNAAITLNGTGSPAIGGILFLAANETVGPLTLNAGAVSTQGGSLTLADNVTASGVSLLEANTSLGSATRTFTVAAGGDLRVGFSRTISGGAGIGLTKEGPGQLRLDGAATYPGTTTVNAGTLLVGGVGANPATIAGPVVVNSGATIAGFGQVNNLTLAGGRFDPVAFAVSGAATPGVLSASGAVAMDSASVFHTDIAGTAAGGATGHDQMRVLGTGSVNLGNARLEVAFAPGFTSSVNNTYTVVRNDSATATSGAFTDATGTPIAQGGEILVNSVRLRMNYSGGDFNDVVLTHVNSPSLFPNRAITPLVREGGIAVLTGQRGDADPNDVFILDVNWGDGSTETFAFGPGDPRDIRITHRYLDNPSGSPVGTYNVQLRWRDQHGEGNSGTLQVVVANVAPSVFVGPIAVLRAGQTLDRFGFFSDPGRRDTHRATVDYGDGTGQRRLNLDGSAFRLQHRYRRAGLYRVTVTITDDDGGVGSASFFVLVLP